MFSFRGALEARPSDRSEVRIATAGRWMHILGLSAVATVTATIEHSLESGPGITGDRTGTTAVLESGALMDAVKWRLGDWSDA